MLSSLKISNLHFYFLSCHMCFLVLYVRNHYLIQSHKDLFLCFLPGFLQYQLFNLDLRFFLSYFCLWCKIRVQVNCFGQIMKIELAYSWTIQQSSYPSLSSVQSLSCIGNFVTPWTAARQPACPQTTPGVYSNSCSLSQ